MDDLGSNTKRKLVHELFMLNKACPFCKKYIDIESESCPHCTRILRENTSIGIFVKPHIVIANEQNKSGDFVLVNKEIASSHSNPPKDIKNFTEILIDRPNNYEQRKQKNIEIGMPEPTSEELTLEEYKQEVSIYKKYRGNISQFREKLDTLEKEKKSLYDSCSHFFSYATYAISFFLTFLLLFFIAGDGRKDFLWSLISSVFIALYPVIIFDDVFRTDFITNIFSSGKLNEIKKTYEEIKGHIRKIEELKGITYRKLQPFEKAVRDHYEVQLRNFFENNLYRKRSGSLQFDEALSEFSSTIEELSPINSALITTRIPLGEYQEYLIKRTIDHNFQTLKKSEQVTSVHNFVRSLSEPLKQKEIVTPEKFYRTARKIGNWEEINKKRKMTGLKGEEIAVVIEQEFLESIDRKDLAEKVRHVSAEDGDGLGYDVLSFFENGKEKYIEVKSTTTSLTSPFLLSRNEIGFLKEHSDDAFIYRIFISDNEPQIRMDSGHDILEKNEIIPVQYMVKVK